MREREEALAGGNMQPVVRVGDTVRRQPGPWTPAVHALLDAYADAGISETPRALGFDEQGREVLTFLPGQTLDASPPEVLWSRATLRDAATLLRRLHDASTPLGADEQVVWRLPRREPAEVVCHGDFAPYNLIAREGMLTGVIDCDFAGPAPRLWDVSYLAYRLVPYAEDAESYDLRRDGSREERLDLLLAAYGATVTPDQVHSAIIDRLEWLAEFTENLASAQGDGRLAGHGRMYRRDAARMHEIRHFGTHRF